MRDGLAGAVDMVTLAPDTLVGTARIGTLRFHGGFAEVYDAFIDERRVAIKRVRPEVIAVASAADRLRLEAAALAALHHPNIVEVLGSGEHGGWPYLVLEWLDGATLAETIRAGALSPAAVLIVLEQVCAALTAAHARGIIHRDVKAENIVVLDPAALRIKLVDFGIAKLLRDTCSNLTTTTQLIGTPIAMAPEQILGHAVDARTDVYALGVLACQLLTGRPPFLAPTIIETQELHLSAEPPRPSHLVAVPPAVDAVIARALAKSPAARHATVAQFFADLRDALTNTTSPRHGAALYIELSARSSDDDDLDALDAALVEAATAAREAGLDILLDAGNALLAGAALPGDGSHLRARALDAALALARPRMRIAVRAVVMHLERGVEHGMPAIPALDVPGVIATREVVAGLEHLAIEPLDDAHVRVRRV